MKCNIARDLLPLYLDGLCSEETKKELEEHLSECNECRKLVADFNIVEEAKTETIALNKNIEPLKKFKNKMRRKNIIIRIVTIVMVLTIGFSLVLGYGQIFKTGISFESLYDAIRFQTIGRQFAKGNIEPLYDVLWNPYVLTDEASGILIISYNDREQYREEMLAAITERYTHYFEGKDLQFKGIYKYGYDENLRHERYLYYCLKFTARNNMEYYLWLEKQADGAYKVKDSFTNPFISYVSNANDDSKELDNDDSASTMIQDSLFYSIADASDSDRLIAETRFLIRQVGLKSLNGEDMRESLANQCCMIWDEDSFAGGNLSSLSQLHSRFIDIMGEGYYPTDLIGTVMDYDKQKHMFRYLITYEFTGKEEGDKISVSLEAYAKGRTFLLSDDKGVVYGENIPENVRTMLEELFVD